RLAVGGPARVADPRHAARQLLEQLLLQIGELPLGADDGEPLFAQHRHARRVVAAVLELAQPVDQQGRALLVTDVPNDAAHSLRASRSTAAARLPFYFFFFSTQPSMLRCLPALTAKDPAGTSSRTVVPVPTYAPLCTVTGATSCVSDPMNAPSSMVVTCFFSPS